MSDVDLGSFSPRAVSRIDVYPRDILAFVDDFVQLNERHEPFKLLPYQRDILRLAFRFESDGRLADRVFIWSQPKKSGKTLINSLVVLWWAYTQEPPNEILIVANDFEQAQGRVFFDVLRLIDNNKALQVSAKLQSRRIDISNGTVIKALSCDYSGEAGANPGLTSWDELWGYQSDRANRLYHELTPVPTRLNSIRFITTYAGFEGESELLWDLYSKAVGCEEHSGGRGRRLHPTLPVWEDPTSKTFIYWDHEPRAEWQTPEYYRSEKISLPTSAYIRLHENRWTTSESIFITPDLWDPCVDYSRKRILRDDHLPLYVGVDAATKHDTAAVVGVAWEGNKLVLVTHRIWQPRPDSPLDIEATIGEYLQELVDLFHVELIRCDPWQLHSTITQLAADGVPIEEYAQTVSNTTAMGQCMWDLLRGRNIILYPDEQMRLQALDTVAIEQPRGWRIAKDKSSKKIDSIIALSMACVAAMDSRHGPSEGGVMDLVSLGRPAVLRRRHDRWLGKLNAVTSDSRMAHERKTYYNPRGE